MAMKPDVIVIGSGCSGTMAAQTLIEAGMRVLMVDGAIDSGNSPAVPSNDFITLRETDPDQHKYFLGNDPDAFWKPIGSGAQLTPPRDFVSRLTNKFIPYLSSTFSPVESLALGGLGNAWGTGCCVFSANELVATGLPANFDEYYEVIAQRIGITQGTGDAERFTSAGLPTLPPVRRERSMDSLLERYERKKKYFRKRGFSLGSPSLAVLTEPQNDRASIPYHDMEFYTNEGEYAWRPDVTLRRLLRHEHFSIAKGMIALKVEELEGATRVHCMGVDGKPYAFEAPRIVLAAGPLGSARIALRSGVASTLPIITNPYSYLVSLNLSQLGKEQEQFKTGLAQLSLFLDPDHHQQQVSMASLYTYRSLMHFRVLKDVPLGFRDSLPVMKYLLPALVIAGIHHPAMLQNTEALRMTPDSKSPSLDKLQIDFHFTAAERRESRIRNKLYKAALRELGCIPIKQVNPPPGGSIHYGGSLPFIKEGTGFLEMNGRLSSFKNVFVADGSGFRFLPAKGVTFTLMANAHRVAREIAGE